MIEIEFKEISKSDKPIFDKFFRLRRYENSHLNFTNLFMWQNRYKTRLTVEDDVLYIYVQPEDSTVSMQPLGLDENMPAAVEKICKDFESRGEIPKFMSLEKFFVDILDKILNRTFEITSDDRTFDYVYLADDLLNLSGRKYHSKKNHLNSFWKSYPTAKYLEITPEIIEECRQVLELWYEVRSEDNEEQKYLEQEKLAVYKILDNYFDLNLQGGALRLGGKIIAFTVGEQLNSDTAVIHVEKADPEIRGAYAAINQAFVENAWSMMKFINREEDLGISGLKHAKESYRPTKLIENYTATLV